MEADNASTLVDAFNGPKRIAVSTLLKKSIADSVTGVDPSNVEIISLGIGGGRLLAEERRLQASGELVLEYLIFIDATLAEDKNINVDSVREGVQTNIEEKIRESFSNDAPGLGLAEVARAVTVTQVNWVAEPSEYTAVGLQLPTASGYEQLPAPLVEQPMAIAGASAAIAAVFVGSCVLGLLCAIVFMGYQHKKSQAPTSGAEGAGVDADAAIIKMRDAVSALPLGSDARHQMEEVVAAIRQAAAPNPEADHSVEATT